LCTLQFTPFPNVTVYYCIYRAISHYRALAGAQALKSAFINEESSRCQSILNGAVPANKAKQSEWCAGKEQGTVLCMMGQIKAEQSACCWLVPEQSTLGVIVHPGQ